MKFLVRFGCYIVVLFIYGLIHVIGFGWLPGIGVAALILPEFLARYLFKKCGIKSKSGSDDFWSDDYDEEAAEAKAQKAFNYLQNNMEMNTYVSKEYRDDKNGSNKDY